jgi:hypothetical protein
MLYMPQLAYTSDTKITGLPALGAAPATNDLIPIVDTSVTTTKSMTIQNLFTSPSITDASMNTATMNSLTASTPVETTAGKILTSGTKTGTGSSYVMSVSPTITGTPSIADASASTLTINGATYWASATSEVADASVNLPTITAEYSAHGWVRASSGGTISESAEFEIDSSGNVTIVRGSANVVANAACVATKLCLGTAANQNPLLVQNRLAATKKISIELWYR